MPRELIDTGTDKRYVRRDSAGRFDDVVDVGTSLSRDRRRQAKTVVRAGDGDRGDQKPRASKSTPATSTQRKAKARARSKPKAPVRGRSGASSSRAR